MKIARKLIFITLLLAALAFTVSAFADDGIGVYFVIDDSSDDEPSDVPSTSTVIIEDYDTPLGFSQMTDTIGGDCFE